MTARCPLAQAACSGDIPRTVCSVGSAPQSSSSCATSARPSLQSLQCTEVNMGSRSVQQGQHENMFSAARST